MRAPDFWRASPPAMRARLLEPLSWIYGGVAARRMARSGVRLDVPVICVGNFTAGGAGKTPTAIALAALLSNLDEKPAFVSRGYGGTAGKRATRVDAATHTAAHVGDEPLLLAAQAPTFVARDRVAGATCAAAQGASVVILDDGLQNPALQKAFSLAVVDGASGIGNGLCLPAGPLRAPMRAQWPHVSAVLIIGAGTAGAAVADAARRQDVPVLHGRLVPDAAVAAHLRGQRVVAFAGIGRPEKFYATLRALGAEIVHTRDFADHAPIGSADLDALVAQARQADARLVTTQKDAVRIGAARWSALGDIANVLPVSLVFDEPDRMARLLRPVLAATSSGRDTDRVPAH